MWQDIETAPEGVRVLVRYREKGRDVYEVASFAWRDEFGSWFRAESPPMLTPTHWMPLPPPPGVWQGLGDK